jgi:SAM-dependent methyltransferase
MHRDEEYDPTGFALLINMQERHFWYLGRHRFLFAALNRRLSSMGRDPAMLTAIDLGGGCGGWLRYLKERAGQKFAELALADSSSKALELAQPVIPAGAACYHIDLLELGWRDRWDIAFLLDVIEHIKQEKQALTQIRDALRPGGLLFLTAPALRAFWTWNDEAAHHYRRYSRADIIRLAGAVGLEVLDNRYFMFFLSPLYWAARRKRPHLEYMSRAEINALLASTHRVPGRVVNGICKAVFCAETPIGHTIRFPWGTSILAVLRKPLTG